MFRLDRVVRYALLIPALIFPQLSTAQDCESLKTATAEGIVSALDHGDIKTEYCARIAFTRIEELPKDESIPILIHHLSFKWPSSNAPHGMRGRTPAIESLCNIGPSAVPLLIDFLAQDVNEGSIEHAYAIEALAEIPHTDVVPTIRLLRRRSAALAGTPASVRLEAVARYMLKTYCPAGRMRQQCEKELREAD